MQVSSGGRNGNLDLWTHSSAFFQLSPSVFTQDHSVASNLILNDTGTIGSASHAAWSLSQRGLVGSGSLSKSIPLLIAVLSS